MISNRLKIITVVRLVECVWMKQTKERCSELFFLWLIAYCDGMYCQCTLCRIKNIICVRFFDDKRFTVKPLTIKLNANPLLFIYTYVIHVWLVANFHRRLLRIIFVLLMFLFSFLYLLSIMPIMWKIKYIKYDFFCSAKSVFKEGSNCPQMH